MPTTLEPVAVLSEENVFLAFFDVSGTFRQAISASSVTDLSFPVDRLGGYGNLSLTVGESQFQNDLPLDASVIEVWHYTRGGRWLFLYRGSISRIMPSSMAPYAFEVNAFGLATRVGRFIIDRDLVYPARVDNSVVFSDIIRGAIEPRIGVRGRLIEDFGAASDRAGVSGKTVADAFEELISGSGGNGHWGTYCIAPLTAEGTPDMITPRLELIRAGPLKAPGKALTHNLSEGAFGLISTEQTRDISDIANVLVISGGEYNYPNLISNGYFQNILNGVENPNSILLDGSFETLNNDWSFATSFPDLVMRSGVGEEGGPSPVIGSRMRYANRIGDQVHQARNTFINGGKVHTFEFYTTLENINQPVTLQVTLQWRVGNNLVVAKSEALTCSSALGWKAGEWKKSVYQLKAPVGATGYDFKMILTSGGGDKRALYLDAASFWYSGDLFQESWIPFIENGGLVKQIIWDLDDPPYPEGYAVRLDMGLQSGQVSGDSGIKNTVHIPITIGQSLRFSFWVRSMTPGSSPAVSLHVYNGSSPKKQGGNIKAGQFDFRRVQIAAGALPFGVWEKRTITITEDFDDLKTLLVKFYVHNNGIVDVAGFCSRDAREEEAVAPGPFRLRLRAKDYYGPVVAGVANSGVLPFAQVGDDRHRLYLSESLYGWQERLQAVGSIVRLADALFFADAFFREQARERIGAVVTLSQPDTVYWPGELARVYLPEVGSLDLPIVRVNYRYEGRLEVSLDLEVERKDVASVVGDAIRAQRERDGVHRPSGNILAIPGIGGTGITRSENDVSSENLSQEIVAARERVAIGGLPALSFDTLFDHFAKVWEEMTSGVGANGTVTSINVLPPSTILSSSGGPVTTSGAITLALIPQPINTFLSGAISGVSSAPTFRAIGGTDLSDGLIATAHLASAAVTSVKLSAGAVTTTKLADSSVTGQKMESLGSAGSYTNANITVDTNGRVTVAANGTAGGGGGALSYRALTAGTSTLTSADDIIEATDNTVRPVLLLPASSSVTRKVYYIHVLGQAGLDFNGTRILPTGTVLILVPLPSGGFQVLVDNSAGLVSSTVRSVVTLAQTGHTFATSGRNYRLESDFSAVGAFSDVAFTAVLRSSEPLIIVTPETGKRTTGKAAWTIYLPASIPAGYSGAQILFNATLAGWGWNGASSSGIAATWSLTLLD